MPPPRIGFRFGLRTLLIAIACLACWLGYEVHSVQQRKAALDDFRNKRHIRVVTVADYNASQTTNFASESWWHRRQMGDRAVYRILFYQPVGSFSQADLDRAKWFFPEAEIKEVSVYF